MTREPKLGAKGYCLFCGLAIEVFEISTGKIVRGPFWRREWRHTYGSGNCGERHCPTSTYATPRPHRAAVTS